MDAGRVAARHLVGQRLRECQVDVVDHPLRLAEAREARAREVRVEDRALRGDHLDRAEDAVVLRHVLREGHLVEQDRAHGVVAADEQRALERHVEAGRHLGVRAGQVDRDLVAFDDHPRLDAQPLSAVPRVVVEPADDRAVRAVGDLCDLLPQHPLRVVHPVVGRAHHDVDAVALDQPQEPLAAELARRQHRVHVAAVHRLRPDVVEDHPVEVLVQLAAAVPAEPVVHLRLGVDVEGVRVDPGERAADVEHVRRHGGEAEQLAVVEDRHRDRDVRRVRRAEVRVVVDDHVALLDRAFEPLEEAADVPRQRADVHRRRVRLAELAALCVEDAGAEVLGLADDRRVAHPEEHARHFLRNRVEGAAEHAQRDRIDLDALAVAAARACARPRTWRCSRAATSSAAPAISAPVVGNGNDDVAKAIDAGREPRRDHRRRVVLVDDRRALEHVARLQRRPVVEAGRRPSRASRRRGTTPRPRARSAASGGFGPRLRARARAASAAVRSRARAGSGSRRPTPRSDVSTRARGCRRSQRGACAPTRRRSHLRRSRPAARSPARGSGSRRRARSAIWSA